MQEAISKQIVDGDKYGNLMPEKKVTKAELITMLANTYGYDTSYMSINDLPYDKWKNHWASHTIKYAYKNGWIDESFNPDEVVTREEAAFYLWCSYNCELRLISGFKGKFNLKSFSENEDYVQRVGEWKVDSNFADKRDISSPYYESIFELYANGIYCGYYDKLFGKINLAPKYELNRAEACAFLMRICHV